MLHLDIDQRNLTHDPSRYLVNNGYM